MDDTLADPITGRLIDGRYAVSARIAHGGMATVYQAMDTRLDRQVALKVMHAELARDDDFVRRFIDEAKSVARLSHQNVVAVYDQGADGPFLYLAMEYVPGQTLKQMLRAHGRFSCAAALDIIAGVLDGLAAAHASGIVHRDVKPENVLITTDRSAAQLCGRVKVADFGLARAHAEAGHTRSGMIIGTVAYLAPEQVTGEFPAGPRSDVYSAGVLLHELLTGRQPFTGETPIAVAYQHVNEDVPAPSGLVPETPAAVDQLVQSATNRDPARRPADAAVFGRAVRQVQDELMLGRSASGQTQEHSGLTGLIGVGVQGLDEAPWLDLDVPAGNSASRSSASRSLSHAANGAWRGTGRHAADTGDWSGESGAGEYATGGFDVGAGAGGNHTLVVQREEADRYLRGGREPFLGRWLFSRRLIFLALGLAVIAGIGTGGWWFTSGRYASIPSVAGESVTLAKEVLTARGFQVATGTEHSNTWARGLVAGTSPSGRASRGATVTILVSGGPFTSVVPDVTGEMQSAAVAALQRAHLKYSIRQVGSHSPKGTVLSTKPKAGTTWPQTEPVTLLVAGGPPLPDFVGMQEAAAKQVAQQDNITLLATLDNNSNQPQGTITSQSPGPKSVMHPGETVTITVSNGPQLVAVPYVLGQSIQQATQQMEAAGFRVVVAGMSVLGEIWNTDPSPGTMAPRGSIVIMDANPFITNGNGGNPVRF